MKKIKREKEREDGRSSGKNNYLRSSYSFLYFLFTVVQTRDVSQGTGLSPATTFYFLFSVSFRILSTASSTFSLLGPYTSNTLAFSYFLTLIRLSSKYKLRWRRENRTTRLPSLILFIALPLQSLALFSLFLESICQFEKQENETLKTLNCY